MAEDQDDSQKTEEPSRKRLEEAAKKGQVAVSREVNSFLMLVALAIVMSWMLPWMLHRTKQALLPFIEHPDDFPMDASNLGDISINLLASMAGIMLPPLVFILILALSGSVIQNPFNLSLDPAMPKFERISLLKGIGRLFSTRSLAEFIKGLIKIVIVGATCTYVIWPYLGFLKRLPTYDLYDILGFTWEMLKKMLIAVCSMMFVIAIMDYLYQRYEFIKSLKMTKQEVKDEYKQQEGDPMVKQRLRGIRMERARKRMMAQVPQSDVVITNPTHYAIALKYDSTKMKAPLVVAKGMDKVALRIREVAKESDVPIVENPPLARALWDSADLDKEIPFEHYKAVAEVIGYVYRLKNKLHLNPNRRK